MFRLMVCVCILGGFASPQQAEEFQPKPAKVFDLPGSADGKSNVSLSLKPDETRWFRMVAFKGKGYFRTQVRRKDFHPLIRIYIADQDGKGLKQVASNEKTAGKDAETMKDIVLHAPLSEKVNEDYYIAVSGFKGSTGGFTLLVSQPHSQRTDDYPDMKDDADPVTFDKAGKARVGGSIDPKTDNDWFTFKVDKPGHVNIKLTTPIQSKLDPHLRLHNKGTLVVQGDRDIRRQVKAGDEYWLHVRSGNLKPDDIQPDLEPVGDYVLWFTYEMDKE